MMFEKGAALKTVIGLIFCLSQADKSDFFERVGTKARLPIGVRDDT